MRMIKYDAILRNVFNRNNNLRSYTSQIMHIFKDNVIM